MSELSSIGIFGRGRLGTAISEAAAARGLEVAWRLGRDGTPGEGAQVAIDASTAEGVPTHLQWALETATPLVIGTTGWSLPDLKARVGDRIGVVTAPNFSIAVALLRRLTAILGGFAALDAARDPYLFDHHHSAKRDAPSGTAKLLAETLLRNCPRKTEWVLGGPVEPHQLSVGVARAGSATGTHIVGIDSPGEVLEIQHRARSRAVFAEGALAAARWIFGRTGVHAFDEVTADLLQPLFETEKPHER